MSATIFALPVSVEQIAAVIKQMSSEDQKRLLELVPSLKEAAAHPPVRTAAQIGANLERLRTEVLALVNHQPLSPDEPFLGELTLAQYDALPDEEKAQLWEQL
jgi:hypothetical protein